LFDQTIRSRLEGGKWYGYVLNYLSIILVPDDEVMGGG
jgi:hypothetical protein